jgi:aerobic-type carbon monoxide dehydrogenase small subunit (CoxS/CutS family)
MTPQKNDPIFLCTYCAKTYDHFDSLKSHVLADHKGESLPKQDGLIQLMVNKKKYSLCVEPEWTLYHLIHDKLGFIGSKQFCDRGACGSCTVIMDNRPILSCMALAIECDGKQIETIEGIAAADHPLIQSYTNHHAMQCGYCTPGFVVSSKALLDQNPEPTEQDIRGALAGNICRCGTYQQHPKAVLEASTMLKQSGEHRTGEKSENV